VSWDPSQDVEVVTGAAEDDVSVEPLEVVVEVSLEPDEVDGVVAVEVVSDELGVEVDVVVEVVLGVEAPAA
jgi:hypothetical protein